MLHDNNRIEDDHVDFCEPLQLDKTASNQQLLAIKNTNRGGGLISYEKSLRFFKRKGISLGDRTQGIKKTYSGFEVDAPEIDFNSSTSSVNAIIPRRINII